MSNIETLKSVPLFAGLDDSQLSTVLSIVSPQSVPQEAVILREGERGDSMFILASGSVEVSKRFGVGASISLDGANEKTLVRLNAPQVFGEMGLLEDAERSATITALTECQLLEITRSAFEGLAGSDAMLGYLVVRNMAVVLASRLRRTDQDVVKLTMALSLALGVR